jgi:predicted S18 family serine protease
MLTREMPVFVKIDDYKEVLDIIELMKNKIEQAKSLIARINELKNDEDSELEAWKTNIAEIEQKVENVDNSLLEPESV